MVVLLSLEHGEQACGCSVAATTAAHDGESKEQEPETHSFNIESALEGGESCAWHGHFFVQNLEHHS